MFDFKIFPFCEDIVPIVSGQRLSATYYGFHFGKNLLLLKYESVTLMIVFEERCQKVSTEFIKCISSRGENIRGGLKIVGNKNVILLLDSNGKLWKLINGFEFSNERDECLYVIEKNCFYEWVNFNAFKFYKTLNITGFEEGFACLGLTKNFQKKLKILSSPETEILEDHNLNLIYEDLNESDIFENFMINIKINDYESIFKQEIKCKKEALVLSNRSNGKTYIWSRSGEHSLLNISNSFLLSVINFERKNCLMLIYQCGKLVFIFYDESVGDPPTRIISYLPTTLIFATKCICCQYGLIWSDCINLNHSKIMFKDDKSNLINLKHCLIPSNLNGIKSVLKISEGLLFVTINDFYYHFSISKITKLGRFKEISVKLLSELQLSNLKVMEWNREIKTCMEFFKNKEMLQNANLKGDFEVKWEGSNIVLKNSTSLILYKNFWKVKLLQTINKKKLVEVSNLTTDLSKGTSCKIQINFKQNDQISVGLVGHFGEEHLVFKLKNILQKHQILEKKKMRKFLEELMKKKNLALKEIYI